MPRSRRLMPWSRLVACIAPSLALLPVACVEPQNPYEQPAPEPLPLPGSDESPVNPEGKPIFASSVFPALGACQGCHASGVGGAPVFLADDAEGSYALVTQNQRLYQPPGSSELILHGAHQGPALSASQESAVRSWLEVEFGGEDPAPGGNGNTDPEPQPQPQPSAGLTAEEAYIEAGNCMTFEDWVKSGMDEVPRAMTDAGSCQGCHSMGNGGTFLHDDPKTTFDTNRAMPFINKLFRPRYEDGAFVGLEPNDRLLFKGGQPCPEVDPGDYPVCHPKYQLLSADRSAVESFPALVLSRLDADGRCPL